MTRGWEPGTQYDLGVVVEYSGHKYKIIQAHRSQGDWTPDVVPALWGRIPDGDYCQDDRYQPEYVEHKHGEQHGTKHDAPPPQQDTEPEKPQHWWDSDHHKKQLEVGGGILAGALALGAGYAAYKHHEKHKAEKQLAALVIEDWLRDAKARTEAYSRGSSNARVAWILTSGLHIPPGAIEGGRDEHGQTLYIARAFQAGGVHPGKACASHRKGALIGHKLSVVEVDTYEILVGDGSAVLWIDSYDLGRAGAPHPVEGGHDDAGSLLYVAQASYRGGYHPGKAGGQQAGAFIAFEEREIQVEKYSVLCYA